MLRHRELLCALAFAGLTHTADAQTTVYTNDFENALDPLTEWSSTSTATTPAGARRFLGRFAGSTAVDLDLTGLPAHAAVQVRFDLYVIQTWDGNLTNFGPDVWMLDMAGDNVLTTTFSNTSSPMQAYPGMHPGGSFPGQTGASEADTLGYISDGSPRDSVYAMDYTIAHTDSSITITFASSGLQGAGDESWGVDNVEVIVHDTFVGEVFEENCNGDGGDQMGCTDCPCGNNSPQGTVGGCLNSAGTSLRLLPSGSESIAAMDLRFEGSGAPPLNAFILTSGNALAPANMANPCFGLNSGLQSFSLDSLRCVVQGVLRHGIRPADANGDIGATTNGWGMPNGFFNFSAFMIGDEKHFQIIGRDDIAQVCQTGQTSSQAVTVNFTM